jgi:hypothetical protein
MGKLLPTLAAMFVREFSSTVGDRFHFSGGGSRPAFSLLNSDDGRPARRPSAYGFSKLPLTP